MHGNVLEWCWDWYGKDFYKASPVDDPAGPLEAASRVIRGGGWDDYPRHCRSAIRFWSTPASRFSYLGFRLALAWIPTQPKLLTQLAQVHLYDSVAMMRIPWK
jgi:formylglycine-generating enzyme required for sulfatase activity